MSLFDIHDKINSKIFLLFNIFSDIILTLNFRTRKLINNNYVYKGIHAGQRCFILGTGPSLARLNEKYVRFLEEEVVFGVNSLYKAEISDKVSPKYYALLDNMYWGEKSHTFAEICKKYEQNKPIFITDVRARNFIPENSESILMYAKNYPINEMRYDLSKNISISMNVVSFAIISAMHMGFKEIYLLGCDYNAFCNLVNNHCYDDSDEFTVLNKYNLAFYLKYYALTTEFHYLIARTAIRNGVKIVNLTDGSLLDAYPRRSISEIFPIN